MLSSTHFFSNTKWFFDEFASTHKKNRLVPNEAVFLIPLSFPEKRIYAGSVRHFGKVQF